MDSQLVRPEPLTEAQDLLHLFKQELRDAKPGSPEAVRAKLKIERVTLLLDRAKAQIERRANESPRRKKRREELRRNLESVPRRRDIDWTKAHLVQPSPKCSQRRRIATPAPMRGRGQSHGGRTVSAGPRRSKATGSSSSDDPGGSGDEPLPHPLCPDVGRRRFASSKGGAS